MKELAISAQNRLEKIADICRKNGYGIEVLSFCSPKYLESNPGGFELHKKEFTGIDIKTIHGPFTKLQPGNEDENIRGIAEKEYEYSFGKALELEAGHLIAHHGEIKEDSDITSWIGNSIEFWRKIMKNKPGNFKLHIENVRDRGYEILSEIVSGINLDNVGICLDIGHVHCYSDVSVIEWIKKLNTQIDYVHMHNNNGIRDEHLDLGQGTIDMKKVCDTLEEFAQDAIWTIEVHDEYIESSIQWLKDNGYIEKSERGHFRLREIL